MMVAKYKIMFSNPLIYNLGINEIISHNISKENFFFERKISNKN